MARVKISEYHAKRLLTPNYLGLPATVSTTIKEIKATFPNENLVLKVDQGIKKRGKLGLVKINLTPSDIPPLIKSWQKLGWSHFLLEPIIEHAESAEHYLALERTREGWQISYSDKGGIEIESSWDLVKRTVLKRNSRLQAEKGSSADERTVLNGIELMLPRLDQNNISFLEMNPILIRDGKLIPLDMACEVDSAGSTLPLIPDQTIIDSERSVAALDATTPASLKFKLLNPEGSIWVLLSGGGASIVIADEIADQGMGKELANYGEYSGAPTDDDVYAYTKIILSQLLESRVSRLKSIIIAGGVANFTDIAKTFRGLIRALDERKQELVQAKVKIFVRRGGPNEKQGLELMRDFLNISHLLGSVHGHETPLTQVVTEVKNYLCTPAGPGLAGPNHLPARPGPNGHSI